MSGKKTPNEDPAPTDTSTSTGVEKLSHNQVKKIMRISRNQEFRLKESRARKNKNIAISLYARMKNLDKRVLVCEATYSPPLFKGNKNGGSS